jgi:hypothetical protein
MIRERESVQFLVIAGVGLFLGILADIFFFGSPLGANVLLFVICFLVAIGGLVTTFNRRITFSNTILIVPALFFATMVAWVASPTLTLFNILMLIVCLFATVISLTQRGFLGGSLQTFLQNASTAVLFDWLSSPLDVIKESASAFQDIVMGSQEEEDQVSTGTLRAIIRGTLLSLPILVVSGFLLRSADQVFGRFLQAVLAWLPSPSPVELFLQLCLIAAVTWMCVAAFKIVVRGIGRPVETTEDDDEGDYYLDLNLKPKGMPSIPILRLGLIESSIVMGNLALMFSIFVVIQLIYFFGSQSNTAGLDINYTQYAQRGFRELLVLGVMVFGLILTLDFSTIRVTQNQRRLFSGLAIGIVLMVFVILASAFQRLHLFQDANGFTRWYVTLHVFVVWLGLLFLFLIVDLLEMYPRLIWMGGAVAVIGVFVTLNVLNLDAYTANQNVALIQEQKAINVYNLFDLSDDAVPALIELFDDPQTDEQIRRDLRIELYSRLQNLDDERRDWGVFGYNRSKQQAWELLNARRDELKPPTSP